MKRRGGGKEKRTEIINKENKKGKREERMNRKEIVKSGERV